MKPRSTLKTRQVEDKSCYIFVAWAIQENSGALRALRKVDVMGDASRSRSQDGMEEGEGRGGEGRGGEGRIRAQ